jgi:hypothetical protein
LRRTILLLIVASLIAATAASAATQPAAGTFVEGPATITDERESGGNFIIEMTRSVVFTGSYTGTGQAEERIVVHKDGSTNVNITIAFTGTACGVSTTLEFLVVGQGQLNEDLETGVIAGSYTILGDGIGHGSGKFEGAAGGAGAYEGQIHCE